jgi:YbbR domain-containing protein
MPGGFNRILNNWKVVTLSFVGATTFWFFNALNKDYSALITYPIEFNFSEDSVVIIDPLPENIKVDVASGGWNLFRNTLWFSVTPIPIDLDNPTDIRFLTRSSLLPIVKDHLSDLTVNFLQTDTLFINIERKIEKKVKIEVDSINISLADRHQIVSPIRIRPDSVTLSGAESIISSIQSQYYVMIPETRIDEDIDDDIRIPLGFPDLMKASPREVNVSFDVARFENERIQIPVEKLNFPDDQIATLVDSTVTINYIIQEDLNEKFSPSDFGITADYNMLENDSLIVPILIYYPETIYDISFTPDTLKVLK